jgi:hypothetical protein
VHDQYYRTNGGRRRNSASATQPSHFEDAHSPSLEEGEDIPRYGIQFQESKKGAECAADAALASRLDESLRSCQCGFYGIWSGVLERGIIETVCQGSFSRRFTR